MDIFISINAYPVLLLLLLLLLKSIFKCRAVKKILEHFTEVYVYCIRVSIEYP